MRKLIVVAVAALLSFGANAALADPPDDPGPGPNGSNEHGLCTAYFNGKKKGHEEGNGPGPFGVMENEDSQDYDRRNGGQEETEPRDETDLSDDVFEYCSDPAINPGGIGGNPDDNGRWDCYANEDEEDAGAERDSDNDEEYECISNTPTEDPEA